MNNFSPKFSKKYWNNRYANNETGWDIGYPSTPLKEYIDTLENKELKILIPGAGNAYEAEYLVSLGFKNVYIVDISEEACKRAKERLTTLPERQIICNDFFDYSGSFDLLIEQTFFCAIHPSERNRYVKKAFDLLSPSGKLIGLLFQKTLFTEHPPFGGNAEEYQALFSQHFYIKKMETAYNSIPPRKDAELFIKMIAK